MDDLLNHNVKVVGKEPETPSLLSQLLGRSLPHLADSGDLCLLYAPNAGRCRRWQGRPHELW